MNYQPLSPSSKKPHTCSLLAQCLSEALGCLILLLVGDGSVAGSLLAPTNSGYSLNQTNVCISWGIAVYLAYLCSYHTSGAHLNPAITTAQLVQHLISPTHALCYILAQFTGCFTGSCLVYLIYYDGIHRLGHQNMDTAAIFATYPQTYLSLPSTLLTELVSSFLFVLVVLFSNDRQLYPYPDNTKGITIATSVVGIGMSLGLNAGYPLNPARDLAPRVMTLLLGWGTQVFTTQTAAGYWWIPILAPLCSAIAAVRFFRIFKSL